MASQVYGLVSAFPLEQFQGAKRAWSARLLHASRPRIAYAAATAAPEDNVVGVGIVLEGGRERQVHERLVGNGEWVACL